MRLQLAPGAAGRYRDGWAPWRSRAQSLCSRSFEQHVEQEQRALQQQRRRLYSEVAEEKERLGQQAARCHREGGVATACRPVLPTHVLTSRRPTGSGRSWRNCGSSWRRAAWPRAGLSGLSLRRGERNRSGGTRWACLRPRPSWHLRCGERPFWGWRLPCRPSAWDVRGGVGGVVACSHGAARPPDGDEGSEGAAGGRTTDVGGQLRQEGGAAWEAAFSLLPSTPGLETGHVWVPLMWPPCGHGPGLHGLAARGLVVVFLPAL